MKLKRILNSLIISFLCIAYNFAAADISLLEKCKTTGMTVYWDSLSESGI